MRGRASLWKVARVSRGVRPRGLPLHERKRWSGSIACYSFERAPNRQAGVSQELERDGLDERPRRHDRDRDIDRVGSNGQRLQRERAARPVLGA